MQKQLNKIFRPVLRVVYRKSRDSIRDSALWVLTKVDDSFMANYDVQVSQARPQNGARNTPTDEHEPVVSSDAPTNFEKTETGKEAPVIVLNDSGVIANLETLGLVFSSIFEAGLTDELHEKTWKHVLEHRSQCTTHDALVKTLRKFLEYENETDALEQLDHHVEITKESKLSYSTEDGKELSAIQWPDPKDPKRPRSLFTETAFAKAYPLIDKSTPVGSAGSCFAMEIAHRLQAENFNYLVTEPYPHPTRKYSNSCAKWGVIFNTPSFRQLIEFHLEDRKLPRVLWSSRDTEKRKIYDPFREDIVFSSEQEYVDTYQSHKAAAKKALLDAKVFVLTLGLNEVWYLKTDGSVCSRSPWRLASYLTRRKVLSVEDNLNDLQVMLNIWRKHNPDIKLIVSVSPVPLHATFRADEQHVITANCHSKATLRVAAEEFCKRNEGVYYFPSYETVMYTTKDAWDEDQRHVSPEAVSNVMKLFNRMFVIGGEKAASVDNSTTSTQPSTSTS